MRIPVAVSESWVPDGLMPPARPPTPNRGDEMSTPEAITLGDATTTIPMNPEA
jgi:hypothetical protein